MWHKLPLPEWIDAPERMLRVCREIKDLGRTALDTETTGLDTRRDYVKFWSLCPQPGVRYCLSADMLQILNQELGQDPDITWIFTNAVYDTQVMENTGIPLFAGKIHCTIIMDTLHDENREGFHGLKACARDHLKLNMNEFKGVFEPKKGESLPEAMDRIMKHAPEKAIDYASMDAWASLGVHDWLKDQLEAFQCPTGITLMDYFTKLEAPYTKVLHRMMRRGVMTSREHFENLRVPLERDMADLSRQLARIAGREININSHPQVRKLLFDQQDGLGLRPIKWSSGGRSGIRQPSTDEETLEILAEEKKIEEAQIILRFRSLSKTYGTYVKGILKFIREDDRIYTSIKQNKRTGRISSTQPNLTNLPRPEEDKYVIRGGFIAPPGRRIKAVDYAQIEMRGMAHLSQDENMIDVICRGWDIHGGTASISYGIPYEEIVEAKKIISRMKKEKVPQAEWPAWAADYVQKRQNSKATGFGLNYGEGINALAEKLGITKEAAKQVVEDYFRPYPGVRAFIEDTHHQASTEGIVYTLLGRPRRLPDAVSDWIPAHTTRYGRYVPKRPGKFGARALRQDVNSRIQGTAAEILKLAQLRLEGMGEFASRDAELLRALGARQLLQVHDEIVLEEEDNDNIAAEVDRCLIRLMEHPLDDVPELIGVDIRKLSVPLTVDISHGYNYAEAH